MYKEITMFLSFICLQLRYAI